MYVFTPFGVAEAHFLETPEGFEGTLAWTCFQVETKECWQWPDPMVCICESIVRHALPAKTCRLK